MLNFWYKSIKSYGKKDNSGFTLLINLFEFYKFYELVLAHFRFDLVCSKMALSTFSSPAAGVGIFFILSTVLLETESHGRVLEPPMRSSIWRIPEFADREPPVNYDDNQLWCGNFTVSYCKLQ
jgi:hypothetical protein